MKCITRGFVKNHAASARNQPSYTVRSFYRIPHKGSVGYKQKRVDAELERNLDIAIRGPDGFQSSHNRVEVALKLPISFTIRKSPHEGIY